MSSDAARAPRPEHHRLLKRRAAALARVPPGEGGENVLPMVMFTLGDETYALDARVVLQVVVLRELTPLPSAPAPLFGVTQWRGDVLTILDLRAALGVNVRGVTDLARVVVVNGHDRVFGILADAAREVMDIGIEAIRPLRAADAERGSLLDGITDDGVLIIDSTALLRAYGTAA